MAAAKDVHCAWSRQPIRFLILDDSTSALDANREKLVQALNKDLKGTTIIVIAQKIKASGFLSMQIRFLVLDSRPFNRQGTHKELVQINEVYREIVRDTERKGGLRCDRKFSGKYFKDYTLSFIIVIVMMIASTILLRSSDLCWSGCSTSS